MRALFALAIVLLACVLAGCSSTPLSNPPGGAVSNDPLPAASSAAPLTLVNATSAAARYLTPYGMQTNPGIAGQDNFAADGNKPTTARGIVYAKNNPEERVLYAFALGFPSPTAAQDWLKARLDCTDPVASKAFLRAGSTVTYIFGSVSNNAADDALIQVIKNAAADVQARTGAAPACPP